MSLSTTLEIFKSLSQISDSETRLVQLISFRDVKLDLPRYRQMLDKAGFKQSTGDMGRKTSWRAVPKRKWSNVAKRKNGASKELLLIHKKAMP